MGISNRRRKMQRVFMSSKDRESVVILGAGTAGAVAAALLAEAGRSVTLIDERKNVDLKVGEKRCLRRRRRY